GWGVGWEERPVDEQPMDEQGARREVFSGKLIHVRVETLPRADSGTREYEIVEHPDAVAIVAARRVSGGGGGYEVALVRQFRPAVGRDLWELPAGLLESDEQRNPEAAAIRELREETGYAAAEWRVLAREFPSPGFSTEAISIYLATSLSVADGAVADQPANPAEIAAVAWMSLEDALHACQRGEIDDGKTILGLTLAAAALGTLGAGGVDAMPMDPTNAPFSRRRGDDDIALARGDADTADGERGQATGRDATLKLDNMLLEEYNYASVTAYQALEDRARMFNLYLLLVGVVGSALGAIYQLGKPTNTAAGDIHTLIITLLLVSGILGFAFFVKVIRLRAAFRESLIAMNMIKEFYIRQFEGQVKGLEHAFRWRLKTIPAGERLGSVTFVICYTVAFLGSLSFAGAALVGDSLAQVGGQSGVLGVPSNVVPFVVAGLVFAVALLLHILYYVIKLNKHAEQALLQKLAQQAQQDTPTT
ncbi:MAG: NUDIX hydrolase, partial [Ktedonobacterales bacterium]